MLNGNGIFNISPNDVDISKHLFNAFGNYETEASAYWIVKLCQQKGGWLPFTKEEIEMLYNESGYRNFWFNDLIKKGYIRDEDEEYFITPVFITRCYNSSLVK